MRWLLSALALCAAIFVARTAKRVMDVLSWFAPERTEGPALVAPSPPYAGDRTFDSPPSAARSQPSVGGILGGPSSTFAPEPQGAFDGAFRAAERARADLASPFAQVEQMAKELAPSLAQELRELAADNVEPNPEVTRELLETYTEQKKVLAGQRDPVDSVLKETVP